MGFNSGFKGLICQMWLFILLDIDLCSHIITPDWPLAQIAKELKITPILDKLLEYKRNWIQHVNRMPRNRLPRVMKLYSPTGRRNHGRPLKRLLDTWDRNGSTSGPTPWQIYDDDDCFCVKMIWFEGDDTHFFGSEIILISSELILFKFPKQKINPKN